MSNRGWGVVEGRVWGRALVGKMVATICIRKNCLNAEIHATRKYNWLVPLAGSLIQELL